MCQCPLSLALCIEVIFLQPTDSCVWLQGPQTKCNKETSRNMSRVLNINNTYVIGQIKRDLEPDGIYIDRQKSCSLHSRAYTGLQWGEPLSQRAKRPRAGAIRHSKRKLQRGRKEAEAAEPLQRKDVCLLRGTETKKAEVAVPRAAVQLGPALRKAQSLVNVGGGVDFIQANMFLDPAHLN